MAYVYRHIRLDKNEPFYIGIGSDNRFKRANERSRRSRLWNKIVSKAGYEIEILFNEISFNDAKIKECEFIKLYGRKDLGTGTLCNMTDGGDGLINRVFTPSHRKKLSESSKARVISEEQKEKLRGYRLGVPNSPEARKKISIANTGKKATQSQVDKLKLRIGDKNPMYGKRGINCGNFKCFILAYKNDSLYGKYEGVHDCARKLLLTATKISAVLNGRRKHTGGFTFKRSAA